MPGPILAPQPVHTQMVGVPHSGQNFAFGTRVALQLPHASAATAGYGVPQPGQNFAVEFIRGELQRVQGLPPLPGGGPAGGMGSDAARVRALRSSTSSRAGKSPRPRSNQVGLAPDARAKHASAGLTQAPFARPTHVRGTSHQSSPRTHVPTTANPRRSWAAERMTSW